MSNFASQPVFCLDRRYSTTRRVVGPAIANKQDSVLQPTATPDIFAGGGMRLRGLSKRSWPGQPLLSIITVVFNGEKFIGQTIESVLEQDYDNVEYLIIDGGSTDRTVELIRQYETVIDYWQSGPDQGIYDAINRGLGLALGSVVGIINSDDWYNPGLFPEVAARHLDWPDAVLHGDMGLVRNERIYCVMPAPAQLGKLKKGMIINHPTVFIPLALYQKYGLFKVDYRIAADWDLMIRLWLQGVTFRRIPKVAANFRLGGASYEFTWQQAREKHLIRGRHRLYRWCDWHYLLDCLKLIMPGQWLIKATLIKHKWLGSIKCEHDRVEG